MTLLLLVRHALTAATGARLVGRTPGVELSDRGREQAERLVERLVDVPIHAVVSSPLERCRQTVAPLADRRGLDVVLDEDLVEIGYGEWTGRSLAQLARTRLWRRVQSVPSRARFPGGESFVEAQARVAAAIETIANRHARRTVLACSHGDAIKLAIAHLAGTPLDAFQRIAIDPASVSAVSLGDGVPRILRVNDTGSLAELVPSRARRRRPPRPSGRRSGRK